MNHFPDGGGGKDDTLLTRDDRAPIYTMVNALRDVFLSYGAFGGRSWWVNVQLPLVGTTEVNLKTNLMRVNLKRQSPEHLGEVGS